MMIYPFLLIYCYTIHGSNAEGIAVSSQLQNKLRQLQEHFHEFDDEIDKEETNQTIEFGSFCTKSNPKACIGYPEIGCIWVEGNTHICRCDFQHHWNDTLRLCIPNVFTTCSTYNTSPPCGLNMECRPDPIGSNPNSKICRCLKGFRVAQDEEGVPSLCVTDENNTDDNDDEVVTTSSVPKRTQFLHVLRATAVASICILIIA